MTGGENRLRELSLKSNSPPKREVLPSLMLMSFVILKTGLLYLEKVYPATPMCIVHSALYQDPCQEGQIANPAERQSHIRLTPSLKLIDF